MDGTSTWFLARVWKMADLDAWGYVLIWCEWKRVRMMILDNSIDTIVLQDDFRVQFRWIVFACLSLCCVEYRQVTGPNPAEEMRICAAGGSFWYDSITPYRCQEPSLNLSNCFPCFRCFMLHFFFRLTEGLLADMHTYRQTNVPNWIQHLRTHLNLQMNQRLVANADRCFRASWDTTKYVIWEAGDPSKFSRPNFRVHIHMAYRIPSFWHGALNTHTQKKR